MLILTLLLGLLAAEHSVSGWDNAWDQPLHRVCPSGRAISHIYSVHDNGREDRLWKLYCYKHIPTGGCYWSGYVNDFDHAINFRCAANYVMTGMYSYHSNHHEDRRWQFHCCSTPGRVTYDCRTTWYVNDWDAYLNWGVPAAHYLVGAQSYHDNGREDRRWRYVYCRLR